MLNRTELVERISNLIENAFSFRRNDFIKWLEFSKTLNSYLDSLRRLELGNDVEHIDCSKGCSFCCSHWVEDVYFFELLSIADYLYGKNDEAVLEKIRSELSADTIAFNAIVSKLKVDDEMALLNEFYSLSRPCPLLSADGNCSVYDVRPITCRSFYSYSAEKFCNPKSTLRESSSDVGTFIITSDEEIENRLDDLHVKFGEDYPISLRAGLQTLI